MGMTSLLKKIGEVMLGDFKTVLVDRLSRVETKIDNIENDVDEIKTDLKGLNSRTGRLESVTQEIQSVLKSAGASLHQPLLIGPGSPLKLTDAGEELAKRIGGHGFIEEHTDFFFALIEKLNPISEYDIQEASNRVLLESVSHPVLNPIKKFAYENGMSIETLLGVLGIILRDKFLEKHPVTS